MMVPRSVVLLQNGIWKSRRIAKPAQNSRRQDAARTTSALRSRPTSSPRLRAASGVRRFQLPHREFDLSVRKLSPVFEDRGVSAARSLIDDFAGFDASDVNRQS